MNSHEHIDSVEYIIEFAINLKGRYPNLLDAVIVMKKSSGLFLNTKNSIADKNDRVFPLETVALQRFNRESKSDIEDAIIHTGPYADEMARRLNVYAFTIANDIYFRNNAYRPESEEGRQIIAHELTHVAQYEEKRIHTNTAIADLEREALEAEARERKPDDTISTLVIEGKKYKIRKRDMEKLVKLTADEIESWLAEQKYTMEEQDYLKLLCEYESWVEEMSR